MQVPRRDPMRTLLQPSGLGTQSSTASSRAQQRLSGLTVGVWDEPLGREEQTPEEVEVIFCGSYFLWRFSQEPRDAPKPILQSLSLFLSLYPSLSLLPCNPTSSDTQERQHHQHTSQVAPSNSPHMRGSTSLSSSPSPFLSRAHQAVSGWTLVSVFVLCLSPSHSFPG